MSRLLDYVRSNRDNRGLMAALRYSLRPTLEHRAWRVLGAFGVLPGGWEGVPHACGDEPLINFIENLF